MDIICPRCGEPCDMDELHEAYVRDTDQKIPYSVARKIFFTQGCGMLFMNKPCEKKNSLRTDAVRMLYSIMPDDADGIASELDDFGFTE